MSTANITLFLVKWTHRALQCSLSSKEWLALWLCKAFHCYWFSLCVYVCLKSTYPTAWLLFLLQIFIQSQAFNVLFLLFFAQIININRNPHIRSRCLNDCKTERKQSLFYCAHYFSGHIKHTSNTALLPINTIHLDFQVHAMAISEIRPIRPLRTPKSFWVFFWIFFRWLTSLKMVN